MDMAKGRLYLNESDIRDVFSIPESVYIKGIEYNPYANELEILLFSIDEVEGFTVKAHDYHSVGFRSALI